MSSAILRLIAGVFVLAQLARGADATSITYDAAAGPGRGKHVVFLAGDEEYRSEEGLPMLARILSRRHGFNCTVLFSIDNDGTIDPNRADSLSNPAALDSAEAIVMLLRFRHWDDAAMKKFNAAIHRGVPIVALRTSTHAFAGFAKGSPWESWNYDLNGGWGRKVLGETWVAHWGRHKFEATRGEVEPSARNDPLLRGISGVFGNTDVYEVYPPADVKILLRGIVLRGMASDDPPADYPKKRSIDQQEQLVNRPAMPVAWTREFRNEAGATNRIFCTTMGAATDLINEGLRRLLVNAVFWGLGLDVPEKADVNFVSPYEPSMYGFNGFRRGLKPSDFAAGSARRN